MLLFTKVNQLGNAYLFAMQLECSKLKRSTAQCSAEQRSPE
jgi:hypothetical protein